MSAKRTKFEIFQTFVTLLSKTTGRDQTCRLFQYFCTFLGNTVKDKNIAQKILAFGAQMSATRKVLRFGRQVGLSINIINLVKGYCNAKTHERFNKSHNPIYVVSGILSAISSMLYFAFDHILWFCNIGLIKDPKLKTRIDWWADYMWIWESLFDFICAITEILTLCSKLTFLDQLRPDDHDSQVNKIKERLKALLKDSTKAFLNFFMAYGFVTGNISKQKIGLMGTLTSLIGCHQIWIQ